LPFQRAGSLREARKWHTNQDVPEEIAGFLGYFRRRARKTVKVPPRSVTPTIARLGSTSGAGAGFALQLGF
jgi:hypothetical protein